MVTLEDAPQEGQSLLFLGSESFAAAEGAIGIAEGKQGSSETTACYP